MESALDEVNKYCGPLLQAYQSCVLKNPSSWSITCLKDRRDLTECAEQNVTSIKKVKDVCKEQVKLYDDCLSKNNDDPKSCLAALKNLYNCTRMNSPQPLQAPGPPEPVNSQS